MLTLKDFMETVEYKISEGSEYCWNCYGPDAYCIDYWDGDHDGASLCVTFDTKTQVVYEMQAHDYANHRSYRWFNPEYFEAHKTESEQNGVDYHNAYDDINFTDLEDEEDFLEKARAIYAGEEYDTRVSVPLTLEDEVLFQLMMEAHNRDITLNQLVEEILRLALADYESLRTE